MDVFKTTILNMNNQIQKINLNHSFIFFLFCNIFSFIVFKLFVINSPSIPSPLDKPEINIPFL